MRGAERPGDLDGQRLARALVDSPAQSLTGFARQRVDQAFTRVPELDEPRFPNAVREVAFELGEHTEPTQHRALSPGGPADALGSAIVGIVHALDDALALEIVDERTERLLGDAQPVGELGEAYAVGRDVREQVGVREPQAAPRCVDAGERDLVDEPRGAKEQLEIRTGELQLGVGFSFWSIKSIALDHNDKVSLTMCVPNDSAPLVSVAQNVWQVRAPSLRLPGGLRMPIATTVLRLADRSLLLYSPVAFDRAQLAALSGLGEVAHIVLPNLWHHLFAKEAIERYPRATVHAAPGLAEKRSDLRIHRELTRADGALGDEIDLLLIEGAPKLNEVVLFHRPSGTLVCADLVFNVREPESFMSHVIFAMTGVGGKLAQSRMWRLVVKDRALARASIERLLTWNVQRISPVHGDAIEIRGEDLAPLMARAYGR